MLQRRHVSTRMSTLPTFPSPLLPLTEPAATQTAAQAGFAAQARLRLTLQLQAVRASPHAQLLPQTPEEAAAAAEAEAAVAELREERQALRGRLLRLLIS